MKIMSTRAMLAASIALALTGCNSSSNNDTAETVTMDLRLLETTDIHANVVPYNYNSGPGQDLPAWGLARTSVVIEQARSEVDNHMLIDNGDLIQGSPMGDYIASLDDSYLETARHPVFKAMNYLNYDAGNVGNHEFNYGLKFLDDALEGANFPYVGSNVWVAKQPRDLARVADENCEIYLARDENDEPIFDYIDTLYDPYVILERDFLANDGEYYTLNVGVIGFTPPDIMAWDASHLECNVVVSDIIETAEYFVPKMKAEGADIIIAVPHSGLDKDSSLHAENATYELAQVEGIDAIMFGHDHKLFPNFKGEYDDFDGIDAEAGLIHGVPATMPGAWGEALGVIDLSLASKDGGETWTVTGSDVALRDLVKFESDPVIEALVAEEHRGTIDYMGIEIAQTDHYINSFFTQVIPDMSVQIVNEAQLHALENWAATDPAFDDMADDAILLSLSAPFKSGRNGPNDYTNINTGKLTNGSIADLYVFDNNTPAALKLTGKDVKEWIEWDASMQYRTLPLAEGESFLNSDYMGYAFDIFFGGFDEDGNSRLQYVVDVTVEPRYDGEAPHEPKEENVRVVEILFDGKPLADDAEVYAMTNNYRASETTLPGVSGSEVVKEDAAYTSRELVQQYLEFRLESQENTFLEFTHAENFRLQAGAGDKITFSSSSDSESEICAQQIDGLEYTGRLAANGEKIFELDFDLYQDASFDCKID
ncbi:bifunctional 2',3'-cyclic-nucleotide 2'-phosphodiesterase/3'-nucleotidase [Vibrio agarivorans]|uniref:Bifunctional 2',3'-cyclic-nucleotide 2'-phosphodiesterase/3'-nucleotidase n=1 Tax=Vibrio agarivorans TaxID=153622 RepID=A0ABT7Y0C5_9VIBR|nr:bifunctional 2',3'-cyclic-nucleotide 2'-phosphodiesterase/3'-nucleotidase [Vibrio agarivorans]MDN2481442.1 bifunctional 2',3'-cyclic-nucleotide 2'-phosphodiesterase/3'-nucleotidase [Vibrio agarivorans]